MKNVSMYNPTLDAERKAAGYPDFDESGCARGFVEVPEGAARALIATGWVHETPPDPPKKSYPWDKPGEGQPTDAADTGDAPSDSVPTLEPASKSKTKSNDRGGK